MFLVSRTRLFYYDFYIKFEWATLLGLQFSFVLWVAFIKPFLWFVDCFPLSRNYTLAESGIAVDFFVCNETGYSVYCLCWIYFNFFCVGWFGSCAIFCGFCCWFIFFYCMPWIGPVPAIIVCPLSMTIIGDDIIIYSSESSSFFIMICLFFWLLGSMSSLACLSYFVSSEPPSFFSYFTRSAYLKVFNVF